MKLELGYDEIIKDKEDLLEQLRSLYHEARISLQASAEGFQEVFQRDMHALMICIDFIREMK